MNPKGSFRSFPLDPEVLQVILNPLLHQEAADPVVHIIVPVVDATNRNEFPEGKNANSGI
jgi:hypothetical protein